MTGRETLAALSDFAGIAALCLSLLLIGLLRRSSIDNLNSWLAAIRPWAIGDSHEGWREKDITPELLFKWRHPRHSLVGLAAPEGLLQLTALDNLLLSVELRRKIIALLQATHAFNRYCDYIGAFIAGSPLTAATVRVKLDAVYGKEGPRVEAKNFDELLSKANLSVEELDWTKCLAEMVWSAHTALIGDAGGKGMYRHLRALEQQMKHDGVFQPSS